MPGLNSPAEPDRHPHVLTFPRGAKLSSFHCPFVAGSASLGFFKGQEMNVFRLLLIFFLAYFAAFVWRLFDRGIIGF